MLLGNMKKSKKCLLSQTNLIQSSSQKYLHHSIGNCEKETNWEIQGGFSRSWNRSFLAFLAGAAELELVFSQLHSTAAGAEIFFYQKSWKELKTEI